MSEISSKKIWAIGDRFQSKWSKDAVCTIIKIRDIGKKPYTIEWDNKRKIYCDEAWFDDMKFLEEILPCLHNLISAQESARDSALLGCNSDLNLQLSQKLTNTVQISSNCDIPTYTTTEMCKIYQDSQNAELDIICTQEESISSQLPHPAPHSPQKDSDSEQLTSVTVSPQSLKLSENCSPNSSPSKTLQDSSPAPINQTQTTSIFHTYSDSLPSAGTMRNGLLSEAAILPAPTLEKDYCWLRSPGALSLSGKGRPPGQTKQEAELKKLGLINKGEVLNPVILCQWYEIPNSWLDPSESRAATELLEECDRQQEIFSILESQRSPLTELSISTQSQRKVSRGEYPPGELCKKSKLTPEIFLEETQPQPEAVQKPKGRQCKGCLYKYLENKKLKDGAIASYPRVIGHRSPDNPAHWRWGFNWEIKDQDGEWKGRSIGSVPLGAIALIQSMQNEGVSLEEIIGFIKRAKSKK